MLVKLLYILLPPHIICLASLWYSTIMGKLKSENAKIDVILQAQIWPPFCNCDLMCVTERCVCIDFDLYPSVRVPAWLLLANGPENEARWDGRVRACVFVRLSRQSEAQVEKPGRTAVKIREDGAETPGEGLGRGAAAAAWGPARGRPWSRRGPGESRGRVGVGRSWNRFWGGVWEFPGVYEHFGTSNRVYLFCITGIDPPLQQVMCH